MDLIQEIKKYTNQHYDWQKELKATPQDPYYHGEGDVYTHTIMVMESLMSEIEYAALSKYDQRILLLAAFFHDIGKPICLQIDNGKISTPNHSARGTKLTRNLIYKYNFLQEIFGKIDFEAREQICSLVRYHGLPVIFMEKDNAESYIYKSSYEVNLYHLSILAQADIKGRICSDTPKLLDNIELFKNYCQELGCFGHPKQFPSPKSMIKYFLSGPQYLNYDPYVESSSKVYMFSGLPAAGKDSYIKKHLTGVEMISLDQIRKEMNMPPTKNQGSVVQEAKARAKKLLAAKKDFIWNATNITNQMRAPLIQLFYKYEANVQLIYLEASYEDILLRNKKREAQIPEQALEKMAENLEVPKKWETENVTYITSA